MSRNWAAALGVVFGLLCVEVWRFLSSTSYSHEDVGWLIAKVVFVFLVFWLIDSAAKKSEAWQDGICRANICDMVFFGSRGGRGCNMTAVEPVTLFFWR